MRKTQLESILSRVIHISDSESSNEVLKCQLNYLCEIVWEKELERKFRVRVPIKTMHTYVKMSARGFPNNTSKQTKIRALSSKPSTCCVITLPVTTRRPRSDAFSTTINESGISPEKYVPNRIIVDTVRWEGYSCPDCYYFDDRLVDVLQHMKEVHGIVPCCPETQPESHRSSRYSDNESDVRFDLREEMEGGEY